tara:strand:+ start:1833 stop:2681 length:849 start_codon:yes stop_codon:yes gene_type:complete
MIRIDEMTKGRFGNKILHYNNLVQLAKNLNTEASCVPWEGNECFSDLSTHIDSSNLETTLKWDEVLDMDYLTTPIHVNDYLVGSYCLHNVFWKVTQTDPREFFKINEKYKRNMPENETSVGIHLRGTDILGADGNQGREIHEFEYYKNSIDLVESEFKNTKYYVCTDDYNFDSFIKTVQYLENLNLPYEVGSPNQFVDFSTLTECDIVIASSSTFVVAAGFVGKKDKKIIHSMKWIQKNLDHTPWHPYEDPEDTRKWQLSFDNFWVTLHEGGNAFYKAWKFV